MPVLDLHDMPAGSARMSRVPLEGAANARAKALNLRVTNSPVGSLATEAVGFGESSLLWVRNRGEALTGSASRMVHSFLYFA